jgi:hypothetical protein
VDEDIFFRTAEDGTIFCVDQKVKHACGHYYPLFSLHKHNETYGGPLLQGLRPSCATSK